MKFSSHDLSQIAHASSLTLTGGSKTLGFELQRLGEGLSAGVDRVRLTCGDKNLDVLPTRGMGIWQSENDSVRFGWDSPIAGPVHPMWVPVSEPGGLGWLDGFDEMLVRCGLASNGAPEFDESGKLIWPLHGRIANLPASEVYVDIDETDGRIAIRGTVHENRFHFQRLQLQTEIAMQRYSDEISIVDRVTNLSDRPGSFQMLYHNNFGAPVLESGSQLFAPVKKLVPRNAHAAAGLNQWDHFGPPEPGYAEQVYFMELSAGEDGYSIAVVANKDRTVGASIRFDTTSLPCFSVWKNTVGSADGYVVGLEPATNFPNPRSFEESHGRVIQLKPGESRELKLNIGMLTNAASVAQAISQVESLSGEAVEIAERPLRQWCAPD